MSRCVRVLRHQAIVLEEIVHGTVQRVAPRLGDDAGDQTRGPHVLRWDSAGDNRLRLDDLAIEVGAEGSCHSIRDVDAVDVVEVVPGDAVLASGADAVVQSRLGGRITAAVRVGGWEHSGNELQIALVGAPRGQGLRQLQGDVLSGHGSGRVHERSGRGDGDSFFDPAQAECDLEGGGVTSPNQDLLVPRFGKPGHLDGDHVGGRRFQSTKRGHTLGVGRRLPCAHRVFGFGADRSARQATTLLVSDDHDDDASCRHLRRRDRCRETQRHASRGKRTSIHGEKK